LCTKAPLESLRSRLGFEGLFNYYGSYWKEWWFSSSVEDSWELEIFNYSKHHMNVVIKTEDGNPGWRFTSFYGHPK
jgi:hypothetical protein